MTSEDLENITRLIWTYFYSMVHFCLLQHDWVNFLQNIAFKIPQKKVLRVLDDVRASTKNDKFLLCIPLICL